MYLCIYIFVYIYVYNNKIIYSVFFFKIVNPSIYYNI